MILDSFNTALNTCFIKRLFMLIVHLREDTPVIPDREESQ